MAALRRCGVFGRMYVWSRKSSHDIVDILENAGLIFRGARGRRRGRVVLRGVTDGLERHCDGFDLAAVFLGFLTEV